MGGDLVPFCKEKISILMLKISDDLFLLYSYIYNIYHTLFLTKNVYLIKPISLLQLSHASNNTTSPNIGGDECMGRPPTSNFGGTVPPVPPGLHPSLHLIIIMYHTTYQKC